jgi:hypothetical protein
LDSSIGGAEAAETTPVEHLDEALRKALRGGDAEAVHVLVRRGGTLDVAGVEARSAMHCACQLGQPQVRERERERERPWTWRATRRAPAMHCACQLGRPHVWVSDTNS